jgi:hypothetical protein
MKEIKLFMNEYMFIANLLLFLCYLQTNLLMFRLLFIAACLFFLIFSLTGPVISIDTVIFNISFTIINVILSTSLIKNIVPPQFTNEQKEIFREHFKNYVSPIELNALLKSGRRKIFRVTSNVIKLGNEFSSLFFIAKIGKNCRIELKTKKRKLELTNYSWVGVPEYLNIISKKDSLSQALREFDTGGWNVNLKVIVDSNDITGFNEDYINEDFFQDKDDIKTEMKLDVGTSNISMSRDLKDDESIVILYEFELNKIDTVFSNPNYGTQIMRGLHSIWLKYCADIVKKVDQNNLASSSGMNTTTHSYYIQKRQQFNNQNVGVSMSPNLLNLNLEPRRIASFTAKENKINELDDDGIKEKSSPKKSTKEFNFLGDV